MKIDPNFVVRDVAGEAIIVMQGTVGADMTKIISLNESARLLFDKLSGKNFELADAVKVLKDEYEVNDDIASKDAASWIDNLKKLNVIVD